jgi:hypothetical protein
MYDFLPNSHAYGELAYYTVCYLTLATPAHESTSLGEASTTAEPQLFESGSIHTAFRQTLDPAVLSISESQRFRFFRAMKQLRIKPHYHLSELEPLVAHPMEDEMLARLCSCSDMNCLGTCPDIHSWDRPSCLEQVLKIKSKGAVSIPTLFWTTINGVIQT